MESRWPKWWDWELELSPHLLKRMIDRQVNEVDLRTMLAKAAGFREDVIDNRWVITCRHHGEPWEVVVEPDRDLNLLVVITAYPTGD